MMNRYKPVGWRNESYRHSLAARGLSRKSFALTDFYDRIKAGGRSQVPSQARQADVFARAVGSRTPVDPRSINLTPEEQKIYQSVGVRSRWYGPLYDALNTEPLDQETYLDYEKRLKDNIISVVDPMERDKQILDSDAVIPSSFSSSGLSYKYLIDKKINEKFGNKFKGQREGAVYYKDIGRFVTPQEIDDLRRDVRSKMYEVSENNK